MLCCFDVIVVGCGGIGSVMVYYFVKYGVCVLGFE